MPKKELTASQKRKKYLNKRQMIHDGMLNQKMQQATSKLALSTDLEGKLEILKEYPEYFDELPMEEQIYLLNKEPEKFFRYSDKGLQSYLVQKYPEYYLPYLVDNRMEGVKDYHKYPEFLPSPVGDLYPYPNSMSVEQFQILTSIPMSYKSAIEDLCATGYNSIEIDPGYFDGTLQTKKLDDETRFDTLMEYAEKVGVYKDIQNRFSELFENETILMQNKK